MNGGSRILNTKPMIKPTNHSCIKIQVRPTDYVKGVNSPIVFKAVTNDWTAHLQFKECQKLQFETDGCVPFTAQESFDAQMDQQFSSLPANLQSQITAMGYMDIGDDRNPHFHSSPRFLQVLSGVIYNGASLQTPWDMMRKYGVLPWKDLPYDGTTTPDEYFAPISQAALTKAEQFLALIGGKNTIQYHWVVNDLAGGTDHADMLTSLSQAPLCIGAPACDPWNQEQPPSCPSVQPEHSTMVYLIDTVTHIFDHYLPYFKELGFGYNIPYAMQGVLTIATPALQPLPQVVQPTQANVTILQSILSLMQKLVQILKGRDTTT